MNPIQVLLAMCLSITTLIEFGIILIIFLIFRFWLALLIFLCFLGFIAFKTYKYLQLQKLSNRTSIFAQDIPKEMRAAYYSSIWKKIIDFGEYLVPTQLKSDELLIKVHSASLNPIDFKFPITKLPFYR